VAQRIKAQEDEVVLHVGAPRGPLNEIGEREAREAAFFVLTGRSKGLRTHVTAPSESVVAKVIPVDDRLRPKRPRSGRESPR
jgi:hypothetical protein